MKGKRKSNINDCKTRRIDTIKVLGLIFRSDRSKIEKRLWKEKRNTRMGKKRRAIVEIRETKR